MNEARKLKMGLTLIELLVVIGIIGVLSAVMLGLFSGSGESARATQCMTNLRSLAVAAQNYAMQDRHGQYPKAGSYKYTDYTEGVNWPTRPGWISWRQGASSKSKSCPAYITFNEGDDKVLRYALTNGCIWTSGGMSEKSYRCPTHDDACMKANNRHPGWSYVMNAAFGWNETGKPRSWGGQSLSSIRPYDSQNDQNYTLADAGSKQRPPSKVLLFAEIQGLDDEKRHLVANTSGSDAKGDCVLQYHKENECIGFNHRQSGGRLAGHVAFADGHVEKFLYPQSGNAETLTKWLCAGREVSFNGSNYQDINK